MSTATRSRKPKTGRQLLAESVRVTARIQAAQANETELRRQRRALWLEAITAEVDRVTGREIHEACDVSPSTVDKDLNTARRERNGHR